MTAFTADAEVAAERLTTKQQTIVERLINLKNHFQRKLLDSPTVAGGTSSEGPTCSAALPCCGCAIRATEPQWCGFVRPWHCPGRHTLKLHNAEELVSSATKGLVAVIPTGATEDLTLEQRHQRARRTPCDLAAVADYQDAIDATAANEDLA
jgi:hypothetical protein